MRVERKLVQQYRSFFVDKESSSKKAHFELKGVGETWIGLKPHVLLTPYSELYEIFNLIKDRDIESVADIGCAYGRVGIVAKAFFPNAKFYGYEIVKKRFDEAVRFNDQNNLNFDLSLQNVLDEDFNIPKCSVYFIYDFSDFVHINKILKQIRKVSQNDPITLIAKGDEVRSNIKLYYSATIALQRQVHRKNWSIFFFD